MKKAPSATQGTGRSRLAELEGQLKRAAADLDNYRKRVEQERGQSFQLAQATTLLELAPVLDNFRRAAEHLPPHLASDPWVTGVLHIERQLEELFRRLGVVRIKTVGEPFDPQRHEAVNTEPSLTLPANWVISELEGGWEQNGQVLKPAKVKVSAGPPARPPSTPQPSASSPLDG